MRIFSYAAATALAVFSLAQAATAGQVDWSRVGSEKVVLFYPGVASWEFLTSDDHRLGGKEIKQVKKGCKHCHLSKDEELDLKADEIASGSIRMKRSHDPFEPDPVQGKKGTMTANIQAAYDKDDLYIRIEWASGGSAWRGKKSASSPADRVSLQINKSQPSFKKYGCFVSCHKDLNTMPDSPSKNEVKANPYYAKLGRDDVRLYASYTKNSWSSRKSDREIEKALKEDGRIDLWSLEFFDGKTASLDGWIFDDRVWQDTPGFDGTGSWARDRYTAVFKAKLNRKNAYDAMFSEGDVVTIGMAIHDDNSVKRRHYVSFPLTIGVGADAEIRAQRLY